MQYHSSDADEKREFDFLAFIFAYEKDKTVRDVFIKRYKRIFNIRPNVYTRLSLQPENIVENWMLRNTPTLQTFSGGSEGFRLLVKDSMLQISSMSYDLKNRIYFAALLHKKCYKSLVLVFTLCSIHKKMTIYQNFDSEAEMQSFMYKIVQIVSQRSPSGIETYYKMCFSLERIILSFGYGPIACLREIICVGIQPSNLDPEIFQAFLENIIEFVTKIQSEGLITFLVEKIQKSTAQMNTRFRNKFFKIFTEFVHIFTVNSIFDDEFSIEDIKLAGRFIFLFLNMSWFQNIAHRVLISQFKVRRFRTLCKAIQLVLSSKQSTQNIVLYPINSDELKNFRIYFKIWIFGTKRQIKSEQNNGLQDLLKFNLDQSRQCHEDFDLADIYPLFKEALESISTNFCIMTDRHVPRSKIGKILEFLIYQETLDSPDQASSSGNIDHREFSEAIDKSTTLI